MEQEVVRKRFFLHIIAMTVFAFLAPVLKILAYNSDYFNISVTEAIVAVLTISLIFVAPLLVLALYKPLRDLLSLFVVFMLVSSVIATFLLPVNLGVIEGGETIALELREEAFFFLLFVMSILLLFLVFIKIIPEAREKLQRFVDVLKLIAIVYVGVFATLTVISIPVTFYWTNAGDSVPARISPEKNIFVISFDQLQGNFTSGYLQNYPGEKLIFDGFTFYPDAAVTYPNTQFSISSTLLGKIVNNGYENIEYAIKSDSSILAIAEEQGFEVNISIPSMKKLNSEIYNCVSCSDGATFNFIKSHELLRHSINLAFGVDILALGLNLPRSLTGFAGTELFSHFWQIDLHEFENITSQLTMESPNPSIYFMHFYGTHQPFIYNSDCTLKSPEEIAESQTIDGAKDELACFMVLMDSFFDRLKEYSVYDESMIFVISDHGYERNINLLYYEDRGDQYLCSMSAVVGESKNIKPAGSYNPILFFKDFNARGALSIDKSPASLLDIAPTICEAIGCENDWEGISLRNEIPSDRKREFWQYFGGSERRDADGTDKFHDGLDTWWRVNSFQGPVYPNLAFAMGLKENDYYKYYTLGEVVVFDADGDSSVYQTHGWSGQEQTHRWTHGPRAGLRFNLQGAIHGDLLLRFKAAAYLGGGMLTHQTIGVAVNGYDVATWEMANSGWYEAVIPAGKAAGNDGMLAVVFNISDPISPEEVGQSADSRKLGIRALKLQIVEEP